ncbi:MAG: lipopolysaccharide biosynthesis protein [Flavobacteriaceae bacterium]|nr:lipopolysaccharide biosynthesis protein [Flavobacteriaceae bacterium]
MAYLARKLSISDFGIIAISATLINFIQVFGVSGISEYVVFYHEDDKKEVVSSAFWLNISMTVLIIVVLVILAPFWADFYGNDKIVNIIYLLSVGFFFNMLSAIPIALYRKEIDYKPLVVIQLIFGTISQLSQVLLAFLGFGVYSLAIPTAVVLPLLSLTLIYKSKFRPSLKFSLEHWKKIFEYSKFVIGTRVIGMLVNNGDNLLIARILSLKALGIYDVAFRLANLFINHFNPIITNISLPILAKSREKKNELTTRFRKMIDMVSVINIPVIIGMILFAEPIILLLYGQKWSAAIFPFQILSIFVLFRSIGSPASSLYNAMGKPKIGFYFTLIYLGPFFLTLYFASFYGLIGFCIGITIIRSLGSSTHLIISSNLLKMSFFRLIKIPVITLICALSAFVIVLFLKHYINDVLQIMLYVFLILLLELVVFKKYYRPVIKNFKSLI